MPSRVLGRVLAVFTAVAASLVVLSASSSSAAPTDGATHASAMVQASGNGPGVRVWTHGCAPYAMCIYPRGTGWNHDHPMITKSFPNHNPQPEEWWRDSQAHYWFNLHNMIGTYKVFNNGLALGMPTEYLALHEVVSINKGYNGGSGGHGPSYDLASGRSIDINLTPYNSITLWYLYYPTTS